MDTFQALAKELGLLLAKEKTEGPATSLTFLGIVLDMTQQNSRLPHNKLLDLRSRLASLLSKRNISLKELQETVRHLKFACRVVALG